MGKQRVTIRDIANQLNLSPATISRGLRGDAAISKATRKQIRAAAETAGYPINKSSQKQKRQTTDTNGTATQNKPATIYDIATLLEISVATVSRALNGSDKVKPVTRQKVEQAAQALGFSLNHTAKMLAGQKSEAAIYGKTVTIYDIAKKLRLSPSTVSRALAGKEGVNPQTRQLVLKAANKIDYATNPHAMALRKTRTTIGVLVPGFSNRVNQVLQGIEKIAAANEVELLVANAFSQKLPAVKHTDTAWKYADGLILLPGFYTDLPMLKAAMSQSLKPCVCLGSFKNNIGCDTVTIDAYRAVYDLTTLLARNGCRSICYVDVSAGGSTANLGQEGFRQSAKDHRLAPARQTILRYPRASFSAGNLAQTILSSPHLPDGIIMINCRLDHASAQALQNAGIDLENMLVSGELEYGAFDSEMTHEINLLSYDPHDLGAQGMQHLITKLHTPAGKQEIPVFARHLFYGINRVLAYR